MRCLSPTQPRVPFILFYQTYNCQNLAYLHKFSVFPQNTRHRCRKHINYYHVIYPQVLYLPNVHSCWAQSTLNQWLWVRNLEVCLSLASLSCTLEPVPSTMLLSPLPNHSHGQLCPIPYIQMPRKTEFLFLKTSPSVVYHIRSRTSVPTNTVPLLSSMN